MGKHHRNNHGNIFPRVVLDGAAMAWSASCCSRACALRARQRSLGPTHHKGVKLSVSWTSGACPFHFRRASVPTTVTGLSLSMKPAKFKFSRRKPLQVRALTYRRVAFTTLFRSGTREMLTLNVRSLSSASRSAKSCKNDISFNCLVAAPPPPLLTAAASYAQIALTPSCDGCCACSCPRSPTTPLSFPSFSA